MIIVGKFRVVIDYTRLVIDYHCWACCNQLQALVIDYNVHRGNRLPARGNRLQQVNIYTGTRPHPSFSKFSFSLYPKLSPFSLEIHPFTILQPPLLPIHHFHQNQLQQHNFLLKQLKSSFLIHLTLFYSCLGRFEDWRTCHLHLFLLI